VVASGDELGFRFRVTEQIAIEVFQRLHELFLHLKQRFHPLSGEVDYFRVDQSRCRKCRAVEIGIRLGHREPPCLNCGFSTAGSGLRATGPQDSKPNANARCLPPQWQTVDPSPN
jgi:hypothetical protein